MTPDDLRQQIADLRAERAEYGIDADRILLVVPRERPPTGRTVGFAGRYGPRGEIMNVKKDGRSFRGKYAVAAYFDCQKILDWMNKEGL